MKYDVKILDQTIKVLRRFVWNSIVSLHGFIIHRNKMIRQSSQLTSKQECLESVGKLCKEANSLTDPHPIRSKMEKVRVGVSYPFRKVSQKVQKKIGACDWLSNKTSITRFCYRHLPPRRDFVFRFPYRLRCLFQISEKNSAMGTTFLSFI